ncbi:OX-2 membrane glycoprotein isoform X1 [Nothobranchius furzeri]|uniref:OX-2 membrane glycoprotein-like n=3 Tax=Nothobranchius furzeri TaxID=105023 RepID=A0A9D2Y618_NOTFU|nr:OX-2 membrane glycoprotein isoform X1 [Nothobranchius furzeri]KAF7214707.1 OX-2 membrane glycoprotein-like [Nothobranchius furzeri]
MFGASVTCLYVLLELIPKGASVTIQTEQAVMAAAGGPASLTCQLTEHDDVLQITWQKILPDGEKDLATYTRRFGARVRPELKDNMDFQYEELQNCSVVIREATGEDEGCYRCVFNTYGKGALIGTTCLKLYELHGPVLHIREPWSPEESEVSCSATGRPAPTVTLIVTQQHLSFSQHNTTRVHNNNNTVTVTTTAVLSGLHGNSTQVGCVAGVASGAQIQVFQRIYEEKRTSDDGFLNPESLRSFLTWTAVLWMIALFCMLAVIGYLQHKLKHSSRNPERTKTPRQTTRDSQQVTTPLIHHVNEIKQRTPAKTRPESSVSKQLF